MAATRITRRRRIAGTVGLVLLACAAGSVPAEAAAPEPVLPRIRPGGESGPGPEHRQLGALAGSWSFEGKWLGADGKTVRRSGVSENRWILGGRFLQCDAAAQGESERVESRIVLGFDARQQRYFALLLDNQMSYYLQPIGSYRASTRSFILRGKERDEVSGLAVSYRLLLRVEGPDRYVIEVFFDTPGPAPMRLVEAVYTRREPSPDGGGAPR